VVRIAAARFNDVLPFSSLERKLYFHVRRMSLTLRLSLSRVSVASPMCGLTSRLPLTPRPPNLPTHPPTTSPPPTPSPPHVDGGRATCRRIGAEVQAVTMWPPPTPSPTHVDGGHVACRHSSVTGKAAPDASTDATTAKPPIARTASCTAITGALSPASTTAVRRAAALISLERPSSTLPPPATPSTPQPQGRCRPPPPSWLSHLHRRRTCRRQRRRAAKRGLGTGARGRGWEVIGCASQMNGITYGPERTELQGV